MLPSVSNPQEEKLVRPDVKKQDETETLGAVHNNRNTQKDTRTYKEDRRKSKQQNHKELQDFWS